MILLLFVSIIILFLILFYVYCNEVLDCNLLKLFVENYTCINVNLYCMEVYN